MNESLQLAKNIAGISTDQIPSAVLETTKKSLLDALGVTLAAGTLGEGCRAFVDLAMAQGGTKESTIIGYAARVPAAMAAFANGAMAHALDFEDAHEGGLVHPNAATIPAALAVAESVGQVSGGEFLTSVALGSDLVCRLGLALEEELLQYGWYMPPILGAFGATAAACKLLRLSAEQIVDAFSLTLCQATCSAELVHSKRSLVRSVRDAFSAKAGVLSALLAQQGVTGFEQPLEGQAGLYSMYARGSYDPLKLTSELGKTFEGGNVSFKPYPSCRGTHPYIDGVLEILHARHLRPGEVEAIHVVVSSVNQMLCEPLEVKRKPATVIDAKFSLPFVIATALAHAQVTLDQFTPQALADRAVGELARKVSFEVDPGLTRSQAAQGRLDIRTSTESFSKNVDVAYGHPSNPMSREALVDKFMHCARHAVKPFSQARLKRIVDLVLNLEKVGDVSELTGCL